MHLNLKVIHKSPILTFVINHICFNRSEYTLPRGGAVLLFGLMSVYISSLCRSYRCGTLVINLQMDYGKLPHPSYFYKYSLPIKDMILIRFELSSTLS